MTPPAAPRPERVFYGWVVVAITGLIAMTYYGSWVLFAVFLKPLSQEFGWARGETALAYSLVGLLAGIGGVYSGSLADRIGTRRTVLFGSICLGMGLFLTSFINSLWQLYLTYGVLLGGLGVGFLNVPSTANVPRWFSRNKGLAIGLATSGMSMGVVVYPAVGRYLIDLLGWRLAAVGMSILAWAMIIPASLLLRSNPGPDEMEPELRRRGSAVSAPSGAPGAGLEGQGAGPRAVAVRATPPYLPLEQRTPVGVMRSAMFCCCTCHSIPLVHLVAYATDIGISNMRAASILSLVGVFAVLGRIGMGVVADRLGGLRTIIICSFLQSSMMLWLVFSRELWMFAVYAVFFGIGYGGILPMYAVISKDVYGPERLGSVYGRISLGGTGGMAVGGYIGGLIFDIYGSYTPAFLFSFLIGGMNFLVALYLLWWTRREYRRLDAGPRPSAVPTPATAGS